MADEKPAQRPRPKLLLVEDSPPVQEVLTNLLRTVPGLELAGIADTAVDAMAAFELHRPDMVILDLVLRAGSGLDVLQAIKQRAPACRVVVFTGHDAEPYRSRCLAAGADYFFSKSMQHRELVQLLRTFGDGLTPAPELTESGSPGAGNFPPS